MKNTKEKSKFSRFFSNPLIGFISMVIGIVSLTLVIYFSLAGKPKRELSYYCHPVKATVVKTGQTSSLEVFCDEEKIDSDVTAVQVAIWNNGKESIKRDDILETITLYTEPKTPIIDAVVRKRTREVIDLSIDRSSFKEGFIPINWHILEHNDGGIIQVIFAGIPDVEILAKGIIEGQKSIKEVKSLLKAKSPIESLRFRHELIKTLGIISLFFAGYMILFFYVLKLKDVKLIKGDEKIYRKLNFLFIRLFPILGIIPFFIIFIFCMFVVKEVGPPFGF